MSGSLDIEYVFLSNNKISLLVNSGIAYNYLISGFQEIGVETYNLEATDFQGVSYNYMLGAGFLYRYSDAIGLYLKYDWKETLDMSEGTPNETYKISSYVYSAGIRFNLSN